MPELRQRLAAEFGGTAFLLAVVVGSGIMAQRLSGGNVAIALIANSLATGAGLFALIVTLSRFGSDFNPAVTLLAAWRRQVGVATCMACIAAQCMGAISGVIAAHAMFAEPLLQVSAHDRSGWPLAFAELLATGGLLVIVTLAPKRSTPAAVATYITAAYWFTASTSFANPAVTIARAFTDSFAGIAWPAVPGFIGAQLLATFIVGAVASRNSRRAAAARLQPS